MAHMHYTGTGQTHSFRGLLADGGQDKIRIQGSIGAIAWRITKLEIMAENPGTTGYEHVVKIYREEQATVDGVINFNDDELLAAAYLQGHSDSTTTEASHIIFDNALFSRNIFMNHVDKDGALNCNYYIELEEVKVSAAGMAQLAVAAARRVYVPGT